MESTDYDVIILGGALAGAATATLLLRKHPQLRVLIIERSQAFTRRVGEATVEVSGYFLSRVLGLVEHLNQEHLVKQGMRFWFYNDRTHSLADCAEIGGSYLARVPAYQVDRSVLDQTVLDQAQKFGARVLRPATVLKTQLAAGGQQAVEVKTPDGARRLTARWLVDGSGVAAVLARQNGWWRANTEHPVSACWARWTRVKNWDSIELSAKYPGWSSVCHGVRFTATNHLVGQGWWVWLIPLKGGHVSIGVVFDERLVSWPASGSLAERLKQFLDRHPAGREICADAEPVENDVHFRKHLPYYTTTHAGDGFVLVGDAAGFMDPLYSPGMDWVAYTTTAAADLILSHFEGRDIAPLVSAHNAIFTRSYSRWFNALYKDKYQYLGDFQLMRLAFLLDLGLYYLGVASQPYKHGPEALCEPVFSTKPSVPFYHFIAAYNRRFAQIAASRRARHCWGAQNHQRRFMFPGYTFARSSALPIIGALAHWAWLEVTEGWRSWFSRSLERTVPPIPKIPSREAITHPALHDAVPDPAAGALTRRTAES